ncbi:MAG TPA: branched-chain amino acid ABC transporter permease [Stellaceae bacterium]|nr:branched-chain amino acid ABC transporter permease [Stellaceae bacterium]
MSRVWIMAAAGLAILAALPFLASPYVLHIAVQVLILGLIYTAWSFMGRFGLVSLGHGAFLGIGAYTSALLWNLYGVTPWLGIPAGMALSVLLALVIGYPCFHLKIVGHYFALVTLALGQVVAFLIIAARDVTGGSLGMTPKAVGTSLYALQFPNRIQFYFIALGLWLLALALRHWVSFGMRRAALDAIGEDETAAAAAGIDVMREKLRVTVISAAVTSFGGSLLTQYLMYLNPETVSGVGVSLQIVFAAIAGGMYSALGPTVGALLTLALTEGLRILFGTQLIGAANTIYGILLILFIVFMPRGILGVIEDFSLSRQRRERAGPARSAGG